ncbi:MAG: L-threonylcarbamoyladenylate synthase [Bacilli bacterium]
MDILEFTDEKARKIVEDGYVLALPTETVYGLGVRWDSEEAYERLVKAKNRRPDKPIAVMCSKDFDLSPYFVITPGIKRVMDKFLPGPLTVLVKTKDEAPNQSHLGTFVAGIRIPGKKDLLDFLSSLPFPLQVTSANLSGEPATSSFDEVYNIFKDTKDVEGIVKGTCKSNVPTTVVSLLDDEVKVIRQGEIKEEDIRKAYYQED